MVRKAGHGQQLQLMLPKLAGSSALAKISLCLSLDAMQRGSGLDARTVAAFLSA